MAGFGVSEKFVAEGKAESKLDPSIYPDASIVSVTMGIKQNFNTKEEFETIDITFKDNVTGKEHLDQTGFVSGLSAKGHDRTQMMFERLMHIASPFLTEEEIKNFIDKADTLVDDKGNPNFTLLGKEYSELLTSKLASTKIKLKVVGGLYNGKPFSKVPNFSSLVPTPFIAKSDSTTTLKFSGQELKEISDYKRVNSGDVGIGSGGIGTVNNPVDLF